MIKKATQGGGLLGKGKKVIVILASFFLAHTVFAQTNGVKGKLTVFNTYPVQNVEVTAKKSKATVTTDSLGE